MGVHGGQFQQRKEITHKMINDIRITEGNLMREEKLHCCMGNAPTHDLPSGRQHARGLMMVM